VDQLAGEISMSAYFVANIRIHDQQEYDKYLASVDDVFSRFNGKYLAVDEHPSVLEGEWSYTKAVLIQFPSEKDLLAWYESDEYQQILKYRLGGAQCDAILIHGHA
jgi:uncharacterized protein (DUF1330 family)